jgi:hypothetical protein
MQYTESSTINVRTPSVQGFIALDIVVLKLQLIELHSAESSMR